MMGVEMKTRIAVAESLDEVKEVLGGMELDSERVWDELQNIVPTKLKSLTLMNLNPLAEVPTGIGKRRVARLFPDVILGNLL